MITNIFSVKRFFLFFLLNLINTHCMESHTNELNKQIDKLKKIDNFETFKSDINSLDWKILSEDVYTFREKVKDEIKEREKIHNYINDYCNTFDNDINQLRKQNNNIDFAILFATQIMVSAADSLDFPRFDNIEIKSLQSLVNTYMEVKQRKVGKTLYQIHRQLSLSTDFERYLEFFKNTFKKGTPSIVFILILVKILGPLIKKKYEEYTFSKKIITTKSSIKWNDIKGVDENIQKKIHVIALAIQKQKSTKKLEKFNHIIFYGPPGNGKTFVAQGFADSQNVPLYKLSSSTLLKSKESIETVFKNIATYAKNNETPVILFLDEVDLLIPSRKSNNFTLEEKHQLQNFLSILDSEDLNGVLIIANTNFIENLDDAILRDGRFGNHIKFDYPDEKSIREIIKGMKEKYKIYFSENFDHQVLLNHLKGKSIASIENIFRNIALLKFKNQLSIVDNKLIEACCY